MIDNCTTETENPLVSIIVPVYQVERYLDRCVKSIVAQTYRNLEVILVDDGSPDRCGEMCDRYAEKYANIQVIHQENQGLSVARNHAVPVSKGEYITFVDSDDYITPDYVEYLVRLAQTYHADVSAGGFVYQYENRPQATPRDETKAGFCATEEALSQMNYGKDFSVFAWGKLYKRKLVEAHPYPAGKLYEDVATTYKIVGDSSGIAYGNKQIYYWLQRAGSTTRGGFSEKQLDGLEAVERQLDYIAQNFAAALPAAKYRHTAKAVELMSVCFASGGDKKVFQILKTHMDQYSKEVLKDKAAKKSMKLRIVAAGLGYYPAKVVFRVHEKIKEKMV